MLSRKEFFHKSAQFAGAMFGAEQLLDVAGLEAGKPAKESDFIIRTNLPFIDAAYMNRALGDMQRFGRDDEYQKIGRECFAPNIELDAFVRKYVAALLERVGARREELEQQPLALPAFLKIARVNDGLLALMQSLHLMLREQALQDSARVLLPPERLQARREIRAGMQSVAELWSVRGNRIFTPDDRPNKDLTLMLGLEGRTERREFAGFRGEQLPYIVNGSGGYAGEGALGQLDLHLHEIGNLRAWWRAGHARYAFLDAFVVHYKKLQGDERISRAGSASRVGGEIFQKKALLGFLMAEVMLHRLLLLFRESSSGIFTYLDRASRQQEVEELIAELDRIIASVKFGRAGIFSGKFETRGLRVSGARKPILLKARRLGAQELKLKNDDGALTLATRTSALHGANVVENAIKKIRSERRKLIGA